MDCPMIEEPPLHLHVPFSGPCAQCRHLVPTGIAGGLLLIDQGSREWHYFCPDCAETLRHEWTGQMVCSGCNQNITYLEVAIISLWREEEQACATCMNCAHFDTESEPPE